MRGGYLIDCYPKEKILVAIEKDGIKPSFIKRYFGKRSDFLWLVGVDKVDFKEGDHVTLEVEPYFCKSDWYFQ